MRYIAGLIDLDKSKFEDFISKNRIAIIDLWAPWCIPCKQLEEELKELASRYPEITIGRIDVSVEPDIAVRYGIMSVPAVLIFIESRLVDILTGSVSGVDVEKKIRGYLETQ